MGKKKRRPSWMFEPDTVKRPKVYIKDHSDIVPETTKEEAERKARLADTSSLSYRDWRHFYSHPIKVCRYCKKRSRIGVHRKDCEIFKPRLFDEPGLDDV